MNPAVLQQMAQMMGQYPAMMQQMAQMMGQDPAMMAAMQATPGAAEGTAPSDRAAKKAAPAASALRAKANELFKSGDLPGAVAAYEEALANPTELRLPLLSNLGRCHTKLGAPDLAVARLREALALGTELQVVDVRAGARGCWSSYWKVAHRRTRGRWTVSLRSW
jgi:tetratricopeptide (TPR) repeat protein